VGRGATLLIHEATFEDAMADEAVAKYHSTTTEALSSGAEYASPPCRYRVCRCVVSSRSRTNNACACRMGAEFVAMFHFSQRYPKIPVVESSAAEHMGIAFDLMSTPLHLLPVLPHLLPPLRALFTDEADDADDEEAAAATTKP
jgi:ribonuclease Z